jgi:hypothetical protein
MQLLEFALSIIPTGCLSAMNAKLLCHAVVFTCLSARARYSGGGSHDIYEVVQPQITFNPLELFTFQVCNCLKVIIF